MSYTKQELEDMLQIKEMSSEALESLLKAREDKKIEFKLVDVREEFEFNDRSIVGTDMLIPTSVIGHHVSKFEDMRDEAVVLYCRTGNRTGQVMHAFNNMGLDRIVHLSRGITAFDGDKVTAADVPNEL